MGNLQWWVGAGIVLGVLVAAFTLATAVGRPLRKLSRQNDEFREDWYGAPARPGRASIPGVPERLARIETRLEEHIRTPHGGMP